MALIGIDVGGTFTDLILLRDDANFTVTKSPTTRDDESIGILNGLEQLADLGATDLESLLADSSTIVHATTTADNTLIEMDGAPTGLITSEGHRDEIELRRGWKEKIWDPTFPGPPQIAKRRFRIGIPERLDNKGNTLVPMDEDKVRWAARRFKKHGISSIAISLLFSFIDPTNERRAAEIVRDEYPEAHISLSHEVMPSAPEFERTSTTLVNAFVGPQVVDYLDKLDAKLKDAGFDGRLLIMQSNGGVDTLDAVRSRPITTLASGPVGGVTAAAHIADQHRDTQNRAPDLISVDMGGTSYDVCLVREGRPTVKTGWNWVARYCVGLPMVDVLSIGAGGGSIASVQAGGLRVGPESAGADPGPICYGTGGTQPTVTDANLLLGYLNPKRFAGGTMQLTVEGVKDAIQTQIADPLDIPVIEAAAGIHRLTNAEMNNAIRRVSSERGHDPRKFPLVAFGGNGPVHAPAQMRDLGFPSVIVPREAPALSAMGVLLADFVVDLNHADIAQADKLDLEQATDIFAEMTRTAEKDLAATGVPESRHEYQYVAACRYPGQTFSIDVPVTLDDGEVTAETIERLVASFHDAHEELHKFATRDEPVVVVELKLRAVGHTEKPPAKELSSLAPAGGAEDPQIDTRPAYFDGGMPDTPIYDGLTIHPDHEITGPAIIEEPFTTIVVQPEQILTMDTLGNFMIRSTS